MDSFEHRGLRMESKKDQTMVLDMDFLKKDIKARLMPSIFCPLIKKPKL